MSYVLDDREVTVPIYGPDGALSEAERADLAEQLDWFDRLYDLLGDEAAVEAFILDSAASYKAWESRQRAERRAAGLATGERPVPIKVSDVHEAIALILQGKVVELPDVRHVNTILTKLAAMANDAKAKGDAAPVYDLCQVSVKGGNLFCASKLRTVEHPEGVQRVQMPQMGGKPVPGSPADKLPRNQDGEVNGTAAFVRHLYGLGILTEPGRVPAAKLKATQSELLGPHVAQMMTAENYDPSVVPIFISRDHYVLDGHHRWAAVVGRDAADNRLGDSKMNVVRIDAPISEILQIANQWATTFGIAPKAAGKRKHARADWFDAFALASAAVSDEVASGDAARRAWDTRGRSSSSTPESRAADRQTFEALKTRWADVNNELLPLLDAPNSQDALQKLETLKGIVKEMYALDVDPGNFADIQLPGGPRDCVIVGAGPGGLTAAINAGHEGLDTLLIEASEEVGGQGKYSSRVQNFPGFPIGISGGQLAENMHEQAQRMLADLHLGVRVIEMTDDPNTGLKTLHLSDGEVVVTRSVIIAGGLEMRKIPFTGSDSPSVIVQDTNKINAAGVGKAVVIVGGSNGAAQAALAAALTAESVTILSRSPLDKGMSQSQIDALLAHPKIGPGRIIEGEEVTELETDLNGRGRSLMTTTGRHLDANVVGVFAGSAPNLKWLPAEVGLVTTKGGKKVPVNEDFETNMPGVYAIGDATEKGAARMVIAAGQGATAVKNLFGHFEREKKRLAEEQAVPPEARPAARAAAATKKAIETSIGHLVAGGLMNAEEARAFVIDQRKKKGLPV